LKKLIPKNGDKQTKERKEGMGMEMGAVEGDGGLAGEGVPLMLAA